MGTAKVVSLDIDPYLKKWLSDCLEKFPDIRKRHEIVVGPALESLPKITGQFDMVFVDANKSEYKRYVELMLERDLIAPGGTIICDNVLYNGYPYLASHFDAQPARRGFGDNIKELDINALRKLYLEEKKKNESQAEEISKLRE